MEYLSVLHHANVFAPMSIEFTHEVNALLNAHAEDNWKLKQIVQVRANHFLLVFER